MRNKNISFFICSRVIVPFLLGGGLAGCIGSQFVVDDADDKAPFPSLHDVPERPDLPDRSNYTDIKNELSSSQRETLDENAKLRKKHGL